MSTDLLGLEGRNAVVTGAGRGGGRGIAEQLARAGANVAVVDLDRDLAETAAREIAALGVETTACTADLRDEDAVAATFAHARKALGELHIGVNNVGNFGSHAFSPVVDQDWEFWQTAIDQNLRTTFLCARALGRHMIEDGVAGAIVNIASLSGLRSSPNLAPYGAVKAGVMHLTQTLAIELAPNGIRVNCVAPTAIDSPSLREGLSEEAIEGIRASIPLGTLCSPESLGGAVVLLASSLAGFVTGQTLMCDGGVSCTSQRPAVHPSVQRTR